MHTNNYEYNDYELLYYIGECNESAYEILLTKYEPYIQAFARKAFVLKNVSLLGVELEDLLQAGREALTKAIDSYKDSMNVKFFTYAKTCMDRGILNVITRFSAQKYQILNESFSLYGEDGSLGYSSYMKDYSAEPHQMLMQKDELEQLIGNMQSKLTQLEQRVLRLRYEGYRYQEIAFQLQITEKSVSNAMQRIRKKIKERD